MTATLTTAERLYTVEEYFKLDNNSEESMNITMENSLKWLEN